MLINDNTSINTEDILKIAPTVKGLNIVTNNVKKFKLLEEYLYEELGISIRISNNKKKDLLQADIILNIDFSEEQINKYTMPDKAIIINFNSSIKINSKKFNGVNINYFSVIIPQTERIEGFSNELIYESLIYKMTLNTAREKVKQDKIKITALIGANGKINRKEFI